MKLSAHYMDGYDIVIFCIKSIIMLLIEQKHLKYYVMELCVANTPNMASSR